MKLLPKHLHAAFDWTDAAGELEELALLSGEELRVYCEKSAANSADEISGALTADEIESVHDWLVESGFAKAQQLREDNEAIDD